MWSFFFFFSRCSYWFFFYSGYACIICFPAIRHEDYVYLLNDAQSVKYHSVCDRPHYYHYVGCLALASHPLPHTQSIRRKHERAHNAMRHEWEKKKTQHSWWPLIEMKPIFVVVAATFRSLALIRQLYVKWKEHTYTQWIVRSSSSICTNWFRKARANNLNFNFWLSACGIIWRKEMECTA